MRRSWLACLAAMLLLAFTPSAHAALTVVDAGPSFTQADRLGPGVSWASRHVTFSPNADRRFDVAWLDACVPAGVRPWRVVSVRNRVSGYLQVSSSKSAVRPLGSRGCQSGHLRWRATWNGASEKLDAMSQPRPQGGYVMTVCVPGMGWDDSRTRLPRMHGAGCAANPVIANLRSVLVQKDWTQSHAPGELVDVQIQTDARYVSAALTSSTGRVLRRWRAVRPDRLRLIAPRLMRGDTLRLRVRAGNTLVDAPIVVRSTRELDKPLPNTALIVMPSLTWLAYNRSDVDRNGWQDSWYATGMRSRSAQVPIIAPLTTIEVDGAETDYLWSMPLFAWLEANQRTAVGRVRTQVITEMDLERMSPATLRRYNVIVFPGHVEYYTARIYDRLMSYRNRGGDIMFLEANSFYRRVTVNRRQNRVHAAWGFASPCSCTRTSRFSDYAMSGSGFTGFEYGFQRPMIISEQASQVPGLLDAVIAPAGTQAGTYAIEFDSPPPADHPSAAIFTPIWHDAEDERAVAGGIMRHSSGAWTFATGNMLFLRAMVDETTPVEQRIIMQRILRNMYLQMAAS